MKIIKSFSLDESAATKLKEISINEKLSASAFLNKVLSDDKLLQLLRDWFNEPKETNETGDNSSGKPS